MARPRSGSPAMCTIKRPPTCHAPPSLLPLLSLPSVRPLHAREQVRGKKRRGKRKEELLHVEVRDGAAVAREELLPYIFHMDSRKKGGPDH